MKWVLSALLLPVLCLAQKWSPETSGVTASLRGVHAVNQNVVWASGSQGTWLRTLDGGKHWTSVAFTDRLHGALLGDPVDGRFTVFVTSDGGTKWRRRQGPVAKVGEASFAASNSSLRMRRGEIWIGSGGTGGARIFHSPDNGISWAASQTPVRHDVLTAGIFGLTWRNRREGIAVGGDYKQDQDVLANMAITRDGGVTWSKAAGPSGFRSAVEYIPELKAWIATGTSGSDISTDGQSWRKFDDAAYNAISRSWAVGPKGVIATLTH